MKFVLLIVFLFFFGCVISEPLEVSAQNKTNVSEDALGIPTENFSENKTNISGGAMNLPAENKTNISGTSQLEIGIILATDKKLYRSAETMGIIVTVYSNSILKNASLTVSGINGRLNEKRSLDLEEGENRIELSYKLPRCNVCGGIRAGDYQINCEISYGEIKAGNSTTINIQQ